MIHEKTSKLIENAERRLDAAMYKQPKQQPKIWDANFIIAITFALIAIAKELHRMNDNNARHTE